MMATEIVLLVVGPVIIAALGYLASPPASPRVLRRSYFRGYGRFWLALVLGASTQTGLVFGLLKLNPNVRILVSISVDEALTLSVDCSRPSNGHFAFCARFGLPVDGCSTSTRPASPSHPR